MPTLEARSQMGRLKAYRDPPLRRAFWVSKRPIASAVKTTLNTRVKRVSNPPWKGCTLPRPNCRESRIPAPENLAGFQNGNRLGRRRKGGPIPLRKGYLAALETDSLRSSLFGSLKRDDRDNWRNNLVLLAYSAPIRREKPRNSMRTGTLAADCERSERLNSTPEYWKCFEMLRPRILPPCPGCRIAWAKQAVLAIAPGLRFTSRPKATASRSRQTGLITYLSFQFWLCFFWIKSG